MGNDRTEESNVKAVENTEDSDTVGVVNDHMDEVVLESNEGV